VPIRAILSIFAVKIIEDMNSYLLKGSEKTPQINFEFETGQLEIKGKSVPEDSFKFFQPMNEWIDRYLEQPKSQTTLNVALEYFNTSSAKVLLELFKKMNLLHKSGKSNIKINWVYESDDDDMLEAGYDYQRTLDVPLNFVPIDSF
jgi:uncharacterized protein (DUF2225 family)